MPRNPMIEDYGAFLIFGVSIFNELFRKDTFSEELDDHIIHSIGTVLVLTSYQII
jgi:hypothetical protein